MSEHLLQSKYSAKIYKYTQQIELLHVLFYLYLDNNVYLCQNV